MATPRYLTAQRISLLVLTRLYCTSTLPSSATIPLLSFMLANSIPAISSSARSCHTSTSTQQEVSFSIDAFEEVLQGHASSIPGRTILDLFLKHMWEMNCFDALHDLFDVLLELVSPPPPGLQEGDHPDRVYLTAVSPLGAFVRRAHLEFTRLQFDDSMKLWSSFIKYRAPTAQWTKRLAGLASGGIDTVVSEMGLKSGDDLYEAAYGHLERQDEEDEGMSLDDFDRVLEFQLDRLQRFGDRVPEDIKPRLRSLVTSSSLIHQEAHLVHFIDAWNAGDYTSAVDNLHRYYDYALRTRKDIQYQYALLHMAMLEADFGYFDEAIAAVNETIVAAREDQDLTCLSFSLTWLHHMVKAYPRHIKSAGYMSMLGSEKEALTFLKSKAKEVKNYNILSISLLTEANLCLSTGDSITRALGNIYQSFHLNLKEDASSFGSHMLLVSTLFSRLGIPHLADVHCELLLDCYKHSCPVDERIRAIGRRAFILSQRGRYDDAISAFESIDPLIHKSMKFHQYIILSVALIKLKRAIRRFDWPTCTQLLATLGSSIDISSSSIEPELSFLQHETCIDYLVSRGLYSETFTAISSLAKSLNFDKADILQRVSVLLMQADLWMKVGKPERGFSVALRAASVSFKAKLGPSLWGAVAFLGNILNAVDDCGTARRLIEAVLPQALEGADSMLTGTLYSHLADSYLGLANPSPTPNSTASSTTPKPSSPTSIRLRLANIAKADLYIDRARECFKNSNYLDRECEQLMKKATIAKLRGDEKLAEEWAQNHNRVWDEALRQVSGDV